MSLMMLGEGALPRLSLKSRGTEDVFNGGIYIVTKQTLVVFHMCSWNRSHQ